MYQLNEKIRDLKPYDPIEGNYRIRLDANESFVPLPYTVMTKLLEKTAFLPYNRYPDPTAEDVCKAFARYYGIDPALVTAGNGSDELISLIMTAFLMKGEKVVTLSPDFSMYKFYASIAEADCIELEKQDDLTIDVDAQIEFCNSNGVRLLIFSNPCNPTSLGLGREETRRLIRSVDALVVLDEAYMDFWNQSLLPEAADFDNLIILRTCSKAFGLAGLRLGMAVANKVLTNALKAVKSPYNVNALSQAIAAEVILHPGLLEEAIRQVLESRDTLFKGIQELSKKHSAIEKIYEPCTNFVFLQVKDAQKIHAELLAHSIAVRLIGGKYLRITAGTEEENRSVLAALEDILTKEG